MHTKTCAHNCTRFCVRQLWVIMSGKKLQAGAELEALRMQHFRERGERLKEERKRLNFSLIEFANLLGIHRNTQGNYEAGREPPTSYLLAVQELGVDIAYVMDGERLRGVASHCAMSMLTIFTRAHALGLCDLHPGALSRLAFLIAKQEEWCSSGFIEELDDAQLDLLFDEAFRNPDEFDEAAIAISKYGHLATGESPSPKEEAAMILDTLSTYAEHRDRLHLNLRDNMRMIAEGVVMSRAGKSDDSGN